MEEHLQTFRVNFLRAAASLAYAMAGVAAAAVAVGPTLGQKEIFDGHDCYLGASKDDASGKGRNCEYMKGSPSTFILSSCNSSSALLILLFS